MAGLFFSPLLSCVIFALVHLYAGKGRALDKKNHKATHSRFLSFGGGVALSYVFIDLLPKLSKSDQKVSQALHSFLPFLERHVYIMALLGFLLFFLIDRAPLFLKKKGSFTLSLASYALLNFFVGYAVVDKNNTEVQPLLLFTFAMGLHYFTNDFALNEAHGKTYNHFAKWLLIGALFLGWGVGIFYVLSGTAVALISAFIGGGVIMNVTRHELKKTHLTSLPFFIGGAFLYTLLLLCLG